MKNANALTIFEAFKTFISFHFQLSCIFVRSLFPTLLRKNFLVIPEAEIRLGRILRRSMLTQIRRRNRFIRIF